MEGKEEEEKKRKKRSKNRKRGEGQGGRDEESNLGSSTLELFSLTYSHIFLLFGVLIKHFNKKKI